MEIKLIRGQEDKKARRQAVIFATQKSHSDYRLPIIFYRFAFCLLLLILLMSHVSRLTANAADTVIKGGICLDKVPKGFYGTWRVSSKIISTNSEGLFKDSSVDLWNLSRVGDVITLDNPFSGAKASITISHIEGRAIKFKKIGDYEGKKITDTVQLVLEKDKFKGVNNIKLDTISEMDGHVIKTEWVLYNLTGEKISGETVK